MSQRITGIVHELQLELFQIESALSEFEQKRKEIKAQLAELGAGTKRCTRCAVTMDIEQFYRDAQKFDKRSSWCMECLRKQVTERYYRNRSAAA